MPANIDHQFNLKTAVKEDENGADKVPHQSLSKRMSFFSESLSIHFYFSQNFMGEQAIALNAVSRCFLER
jgi:hypothetical protein